MNLGGDGAVVFRVLCPVDRIEAVSRLLVGGTGIRFDCASASPFPSDRVLLISSSSSSSAQAQAQSALLSVFDCIVLPSTHQYHHHHHLPVVCRLLSPTSPHLCIQNMPKAAATFDHLHQETGAHIQVFAKDRAFPAFTGPPQELLTISGTFTAVRNALVAVSTFLLDIAASAAESTTQMILPYQYLPFLTANDAADLSHIKQLSGANLTVEDPKAGETTGKVIILGTAEQTKTAQSLLHGLIFCGVFNPS
ncbi:hypothetical protein FCM35_KLT16330 [Carex littledalei]|uniref:K Homology domain-containing protein n=1 Tax=Carex littledalei TaxID=544730 RepID=A0A833RCI5_9POAL|nr:hypothetical protein FCM35_KLT16330 [Carex littledalei]